MGAALELVQFHCCSCLLHSADLPNMNALVVFVVQNLEEDCSQSTIICINKYNILSADAYHIFKVAIYSYSNARSMANQ